MIKEKLLQNLQRFLGLHILFGLTVTILSIYMIITGHYDSIQARQSNESILGWVAIIGMLYTVSFWFAYLFRDQWFNLKGVGDK